MHTQKERGSESHRTPPLTGRMGQFGFEDGREMQLAQGVVFPLLRDYDSSLAISPFLVMT